MELIGKKIVKLQDSKFKTHKNGSNEASIFIDQEIASKINLIDDEEISFIINEENLLRALSFVFQFKKPLYKKEQVILDQEWFDKEYEIIKNHFKKGNIYTCKSNVSKDRFYLKELPQQSGLNIRNLLIENHFELEFSLINDQIHLNLKYSDSEFNNELNFEESRESSAKPIIENKRLTAFTLSVFKLLISEFGEGFLYDNLTFSERLHNDKPYSAVLFNSYFGSNKLLGAFENKQTKESLKTGISQRFNPENLKILNKDYIYFSAQWSFPEDVASPNFTGFANFVKDFSNSKYKIQFDKDKKLYTFFILKTTDRPLQKIYFGSPGTGKSRLIKSKIGDKWPRITFHPELDYQGFVGSYKPTMKPSLNGGLSEEISYEYVPEAFIKAYCKAWKTNTPYYLIIEEINRGNCAQIFGDIFQLLDRDEKGYSEYAIECSPDIQKFLLKEFMSGFDRISEYIEKTGVDDFSKMTLPNNLSILATMNTSDQSLFPMDSAFKRRWDWQYVPIDYADADENLEVSVDNIDYNWGRFIKAVNKQVKQHTQSEDKQIGNRFVSPSDGKISKNQFVSKVLFYLWSEIYKDEQGSGNTIFINADTGKELTFGEFFDTSGKVINEVLIGFLKYILPDENVSDSNTESENDVEN